MSRAKLLVGMVVGGFVVALLVSRLPLDVFASARAFLLLAASLALLLLAAALFLLPARRLLARTFGLPLTLEGRLFGLPREDEMRTMLLQPLVVAGVCLGVVALSAALR